MSAAREEVLRRVRSSLAAGGGPREVEVPRDYRADSPLSADEARERFVARVSDYRAGVRRVDDEAVGAAVAEAFAAHGARTVMAAPGVPAGWRPEGLSLAEDDGTATARDMDRLDGVLTGAALAIAETGTIVLDGGGLSGRRALSLVCDLHVCVVGAGQIVGGVPEAIRALEPAARAGRPITLVSGPSATSDIELSRVEGVHGPRRLEVIVAAGRASG